MKRLFLGFLLLAASLGAEPRVFTDQFGRTITAELVSVQGETVRIRRDDGQVFDLEIAKLDAADQKFIREWAAANGKAGAGDKAADTFKPDPKKITLLMSRTKFSSRTLAVYEGYTHKHEMWGYSIELTNEHVRPIENLRVEYNLFALQFSDSSTPNVLTGVQKFDVVKGREKAVLKTAAAEVCRQRDSYFGNSGGEMRGIWVRVYLNDELIIEQGLPESLRTSEKWKQPKLAAP